MFPRRRIVAVCLLLAVLGLSLLFVHTQSITPRAMRIADVGGDDLGLPVRVEGHIHRITTSDEGNVVLVLMDYADFATIRVIARPWSISSPALAAPGALVEATGEVFGSSGAIQLFVDAVEGVIVREPPASNLRSLEFVATNAARLEGQRVVVRALVADIHAAVDPRHARLHSDGVSLWAYNPDGWTAALANLTGRLVITSRGRCEMFAGPEPMAVETTLATLAACPNELVGQPVAVRHVVVEPGEFLGTALTLRDLGDVAEYRMAAFVPAWDWRAGDPSVRPGDLVHLEGTVEYRAVEARWQIVTDAPPR